MLIIALLLLLLRNATSADALVRFEFIDVSSSLQNDQLGIITSMNI